jgi:hypothetical protein
MLVREEVVVRGVRAELRPKLDETRIRRGDGELVACWQCRLGCRRRCRQGCRLGCRLRCRLRCWLRRLLGLFRLDESTNPCAVELLVRHEGTQPSFEDTVLALWHVRTVDL